ncbi:MAG: YihA family ribosome biogenesis GTP-binding protein [Alphaproteobacteria bacterium]|nr:YihA family ribosome biogenesis GTP-binding protein [Alphaproteobacteria bacterium]
MTQDPPATSPDFSEEAIERGRVLFAQDCAFFFAAARADGLPPNTLPEIAFAGRSNVGKSSLLNALTHRRSLARVSHTPGRTREINFFALGGRLHVVDLPGYGYARVAKSQSKVWNTLIIDYLRGRPSLRRVLLLIDSRHGLKDLDRDVMAVLDQAAVSYQIVLTKADAPKAGDLARTIAAVSAETKKHGAAHPVLHVTSSSRGDGIAALRAELESLAD